MGTDTEMKRAVFIAGALAAPVAASLPLPTVAKIAKRPGAVPYGDVVFNDVPLFVDAHCPALAVSFWTWTNDGLYRFPSADGRAEWECVSSPVPDGE